ncbi:hypothetical protein [Georgenia deserti]|uniref:LPXTG cell wall anchor domain-containing protein n=1 Tax=Georgenia deserti TaxID=2093781 RepID=A0ABW4L2U6_9MICO
MRIAAVVCLALALLLAAPARAAADEVALSADGATWSADLTDPLFDPELRWVPGDARTADLWVRNDGDGAAELTVAAHIADGDGLIANRDIALEIRRGDGTWAELVAQDAIELGRMDDGEAEQLEVRAAFDPESGNASMSRTLRFSFEVTLTQADDPQDPGDQEGEAPGGGGGDRPGDDGPGDGGPGGDGPGEVPGDGDGRGPGGEGDGSGGDGAGTGPGGPGGSSDAGRDIGTGPLPGTGMPAVTTIAAVTMLLLGAGAGLIRRSRKDPR